MNYSFLALLALVASISAAQTHPREYYEQMFFDHMQQFKLEFADGKEFAQRLQIFANNVDVIEAHNADRTQTYTLGVNQFSHMTFDEFVDAVHLNTKPPALRGGADFVQGEPLDASANPATVDWTAAGKVGKVKDQGNCGSCWSFSAIGAVESAIAIRDNTSGTGVLDLAEQHLVSCDTTDSGCNGGWMDTAFSWMKKNGGVADEAHYSYTSGTSGQSGTCKSTTNHANTVVKSYTDVQTNSVSALETAVVKQPVSIAIQANQAAFQSYKSGIITSNCGQRLDHGVLLVGYGTDAGTPYWKVKNSWGATWGEQGYVRIKKDSSNLCGVLSAPSFPTL